MRRSESLWNINNSEVCSGGGFVVVVVVSRENRKGGSEFCLLCLNMVMIVC